MTGMKPAFFARNATIKRQEVAAMEDLHPAKTNMTMEHPPFEDVFPIENGDFPMSC